MKHMLMKMIEAEIGTPRSIAEKKSLKFGTCVNSHAFFHDPMYLHVLVREFNMITPENAMKFASLCPKPGQYNFVEADNLVQFSEDNRLELRGHVLVWHDQLPEWLVKGNYSKRNLIQLLDEHIYKVVSRYAGRIKTWDVINEAVDMGGNFRRSFWFEKLGPEYLEIAFHSAHQADPKATLFYNDVGIEGTLNHRKSVYNLIRSLRSKGVPVHGVGLQTHLSVEHSLSQMDVRDFKKYQEAGLMLEVTELDVRMNNEVACIQQINKQAELYAGVIKLFVGNLGCKTVCLWGFTDRYSWIPFFYQGQGSATVMKEDFTTKPAYQAIALAFSKL